MQSTAKVHSVRVSVHSNEDWKRAIAGYERDVRTGVITFDNEGFATSYPGQAKCERGIADFVSSKLPVA